MTAIWVISTDMPHSVELLLSCQNSPDYCEFLAYRHCSHQFEIINYKLLAACHQVQIQPSPVPCLVTVYIISTSLL